MDTKDIVKTLREFADNMTRYKGFHVQAMNWCDELEKNM